MPVEFDVLKKPDLTYVRLVGDVELGDLLAYIKSYQAHPEYRPGRDELFDLSQWTDTKMGYAEMCAMRRAERTLYPKHPQTRAKCGIYAPSELQYGMARIYASLTELTGDVEAVVFEDMNATLGFLGVSPDDVDR